MILETENIVKVYRKHQALDHVTLRLEPGIYGLLGPNGAGKSTLLDILATTLKPTSGKVLFDGKPVSALGADYRVLLGYLPQNPPFYRYFSAEDFLEYMCALKGIDKNDIKRQTETVLKDVGLFEARRKKIREYSGGMRQRLGIAQAMLGSPDILLLDEPTVGLDPTERNHFTNVLGRLSENHIILLSTHIVSDIESLAQHLIVIGSGKIAYYGTLNGFAQQTKGKVYELRLPSNEQPKFPEYTVIASVRSENSVSLYRFISREMPKNEEAVEVPATIQDAYLSIFGEGAEI